MVNHDTTSKKAKPSICIPHSINNTNWLFVKNTFEKIFDSNCIKKVDIINKKNKNNIDYSCIFIHFIEWPSSDYAQNIREKLLNGDEIKVIYNFPLYWKCYASRY